MSRQFRRIVWAVAGLLMLTISPTATVLASGTRPVRVNTAATTATAFDFTFSVLTAGGVRTGTCRQAIQALSIGSIGDWGPSTITFRTCTFSGVSVTVNQNHLWTGDWYHLDDLAGAVSAVTMHDHVAGLTVSGAGCLFSITGPWLGGTPVSIAHGVLMNISSMRFPASLTAIPLSLSVDSVSGTCALLGIAGGNLASMTANFTFFPTVNLAAL